MARPPPHDRRDTNDRTAFMPLSLNRNASDACVERLSELTWWRERASIAGRGLDVRRRADRHGRGLAAPDGTVAFAAEAQMCPRTGRWTRRG
jgi:hypothetical protein